MSGQAAVVACQLAVHCRRPADMGRMAPEEWREGVAATGAPAPQLPEVGGETLLLKSGYSAHTAQARPVLLQQLACQSNAKW